MFFSTSVAKSFRMVPGAAFLEATGQAPSLPGPDEPGPFSLSEPDRITQVLTDAGFRTIDMTSHESVATIPEADLDALVALGARVGPVRDYLRDADEMTRERLNGELLNIWQETGTTIVFVTHSIPEAVFLSTRVVVMSPRPGRIAKVVPISLPYPRDDVTREDPRYFAHVSEVRELLRELH